MFPIKAAALLLTIVALLLPATTYSQELLTLEQAIKIGLENNYSIRIADKQDDVASNNVTLGNAGFLPTVDGRATRLFNENNSRQEFAGREPIERTGAS